MSFERFPFQKILQFVFKVTELLAGNFQRYSLHSQSLACKSFSACWLIAESFPRTEEHSKCYNWFKDLLFIKKSKYFEFSSNNIIWTEADIRAEIAKLPGDCEGE